MDLKELFGKAEDGKLSYEDFEKLTKEEKIKLVNLSEGGYVSKNKYEDDLKAKDDEIEVLNATINTREEDLQGLQAQLQEAGNDVDKLSNISSQFEELQAKYQDDVDKYQKMLEAQRYEYAVKDFASGLKFSSQASKRDFISSMQGKGLTMEGDKILGADDFVSSYRKDNEDAFIKEEPEAPKDPETPPVPSFAGPTPGTDVNTGKDNSEFHFDFTPINKTQK